MKTLLTLILVTALPLNVFAADDYQETEKSSEAATTPDPEAMSSEPQDGITTSPVEMPASEQPDARFPKLDTPAAEPRERFILFIDALQYRSTSLDIEANYDRGKGETSIRSSSTRKRLLALDSTIGLKSYHDRMILGFGISADFSTAASEDRGGVLIGGYQLLEGLEVGGLLYIAAREKKSSTDRDDSIGGPVFTNSEEARNSSSIYSFGPWLKLRTGNYWQAQFTIYYAISQTEQTSNSEQQSDDTPRTFRNLTTSIERSYFALDLAFGPRLPITEKLTFVPYINVTWYLPRQHKQTTTLSTSGSSPTSEEVLEFDEHPSLDYTLVLGGLRYEF